MAVLCASVMKEHAGGCHGRRVGDVVGEAA
jgi:hypothetical protein